jgi:hypothetical protein
MMETRKALRKLVNDTLTQTPEYRALPRVKRTEPRIYGLPVHTLNRYDEMLYYPPCFNTNDRDEELDVQLEFSYTHRSQILDEITDAVREIEATGAYDLTQRAPWAEAEPRFQPRLDAIWWRSMLRSFQGVLALEHELIQRMRGDGGMPAALGWLMRARPSEFWDALWKQLLYFYPTAGIDGLLDLLCTPALLGHALEESQLQRDACRDGFMHWYSDDLSLTREGVRRVLAYTGLMPIPRRASLGEDTRARMRGLPPR